ncbi:general substrate transporter [Diplocarpon rosae]|nr:general substrate transporter [Diplocarpon rosae]
MPIDRPALPWLTYFMCSFPAWGGVLFGYDSGYIAGVIGMNQFKKDFGRPSTLDEAYEGMLYEAWQKSLIVSILSAGTFFGACTAGYFADWIGRRATILLGCAVYTIGVALQIASDSSIGLLAAGRGVAGLGVGFISAANVMYISEVSPKQIRGLSMGCYQVSIFCLPTPPVLHRHQVHDTYGLEQFAITIGLFLAACITYGTQHREDSGAYRIPISLQFVWVLILSLGMLSLPESPRFYVRKGNDKKARSCLAKLRRQSVSSLCILEEHAELVRCYMREVDAGAGAGRWLDCFTGGFTTGSNLHRTLIGAGVQIAQQLSEASSQFTLREPTDAILAGVNFIFYFGTTFFQTIGINQPFIISVILSTVNVVATPPALYLIDKWGRRPLLIYGGILMSVCQIIVAIVGTAVYSSAAVLITFICLYIVFFASTWGPTGWAVTGDIFPLPIRSKGIAMSTASNWLMNFIIAFITPYLVDEDKANLGPKVFFIFGGCCALCVVFAYLNVFETKGLELEDIDTMVKESKPWSSAKWIRRHRATAGIELPESLKVSSPL